MSERDKEILKAHFFGYTAEQIAKVEDISVEEIEEIIKKHPQTLEELEGRYNG